eukprot:CAMPEP_0119141012 /NCGR_PEP_ID=MMETSP1310-20130426/30224_1 /TAXON_ID=464262 /ORGANISM="Genus nov. species nov., Strain RCC2339" /LENGTH=205 /DNA_ID=CAMNT_0007132419 /DNA_START=29 /DNA_END=642 /DNA_ORIENTATION=-
MADNRLGEVYSKVSTHLGTEKVEQGLKDLLLAAMRRAVEQVGKLNGFLHNESIKILIPEQLQPVVKIAQKAKKQEKVDSFEESLNRAAERAVPSALEIFTTAIMSLRFDDIKAIWESPSHNGATEYLKEKCSGPLAAAFTPEVARAMEENRCSKAYEKLTTRVPGVSKLTKDLNLETYTVEKALHGLFLVCAEKERAVRENPEQR